MKQPLLILLLALLVWGAWSFLDRGDGPSTDAPHEESFIDETLDDPVDLQAAGGPSDDGMVGVGEVGKKSGASGEAAADGSGAVTELSGRVVDVRRRPIPQARVELRANGAVVARATTDGEGVYALAAQGARDGRAVRGTLLARREGYGAGTGTVWLAEGGRVPVEPIVLEPAFVLRARVEMDGGPARFAKVAVGRRQGGQVTPFGTRAVAEDGTVAFDGLAEGLYEVYAMQAGRGRAMARARLPQKDGQVAVVSLGGERLLDVVVVDAMTGDPISQATVHLGDKRTLPRPTGPGYLPAIPAQTTDRSGRITIRGLGLEETLYVNAEAAGYVPAVWWQASRQVARPGTSEVTVRMRKPRRVTFPVYAGDVAPPADGVTLRVMMAGRMAQAGGEATGRIEGSYAIVEGLPPTPVTGALLAPGGLRASFTAPLGVEMGNAVEFRAPRTVRILIVDRGGAPVEGVALRLNPLDGIGRGPTATTDANGSVTFEGIAADKAGVHLKSSDSPWGGPLLGRVDLTTGEEEYTFELVAKLSFVLRLRLDDEARLPAKFQIVAANQRVPGEDIVEDPTTGELQVSLRPPTQDGSFEVKVLARGRLPGSVRVDAGAEGAVYDLELNAAGRIVARVNAPDDGSYTLSLERFDPEQGTWQPTSSGTMPGGTSPESGDGVHTYESLAEGRYRLVEPRSGFQSRAIEVSAARGTVEVPIDLTQSVDVVGKVVAPPGSNLVQARVRVLGRHDPAQSWSGVRVGADGTFRLRAIRGESLELTVSHPLLAPAEQGGRVRTVAGRDGPTLKLVQGPEVTFRAAGFEKAGGSLGGGQSPIQVRLFRGAVGEDLVLSVQPTAADGVFAFGGFAPGTYTLWVSFGTRYAPLVRTGVAMERGRTDLGTLTPTAGSTLVIVLDGAAEGRAFWASVTYAGAPSYARHASGGGPGRDLRVPGLGKGTFDVLVRTADPLGTRVLYEGTVTLDGQGERRLQVSAR